MIPRANIYVALVHHPIRDREGMIVTSAVTNVDVHDIARSACTFGLEGYFVVTPITAQRTLVDRILDHWRVGAGGKRIPERAVALSRVEAVNSVADAIDQIAAKEGQKPRLVGTSARQEGLPIVTFAQEAQTLSLTTTPTLILFGTGHGLANDLLKSCDAVIAPIRPRSYNHLSVRAAAAIVFDRLFGDG